MCVAQCTQRVNAGMHIHQELTCVCLIFLREEGGGVEKEFYLFHYVENALICVITYQM